MDGMLYAAVAYSTIAKGTITSIDTAAAEAAPGVALVMTFRNAPRMKPMPLFGSAPKASGGTELAGDAGPPHPLERRAGRRRARRDAGAGRPREVADRGPLPRRRVRHVVRRRRRRRAPRPATSTASRSTSRSATPTRRSRPRRIASTHVYSTPRYNHNAIELHAATLAWKGDELTIHDASQGVAHTAWSLAQVFGLERRAGARHVAVRRRRLRRQDAVVAPGPRRGRVEARRASGTDHAVARRRLSRRRRSHADRAAGRARRANADGGFDRADPHRHRRR